VDESIYTSFIDEALSGYQYIIVVKDIIQSSYFNDVPFSVLPNSYHLGRAGTARCNEYIAC
jgi:hypothetical protein